MAKVVSSKKACVCQSAEDEPADRRGARLHGPAGACRCYTARRAARPLAWCCWSAFQRSDSAADHSDERSRDGARRARKRREGDPQYLNAPSPKSSASARPASPRPRATTSMAISGSSAKNILSSPNSRWSMSRRRTSRTRSRTAGKRPSPAWSSLVVPADSARGPAPRQRPARLPFDAGRHRGVARHYQDFGLEPLPARYCGLARRSYPRRIHPDDHWRHRCRRGRGHGLGRLDDRDGRTDAARPPRRWRRSRRALQDVRRLSASPPMTSSWHVSCEISGRPAPPKYRRQRGQLVDAMLDGHFHLGGSQGGDRRRAGSAVRCQLAVARNGRAKSSPR